MGMAKNISPKLLYQLKEIFTELEWEIENDFVFGRFCDMLAFLDEKQQELFLELTRRFLRIDVAKYHFY
jgi:hypothetical protein